MFNYIANKLEDQMGKKEVIGDVADSTEMMRAVTWQGRQRVEVKMVPKPKLQHPSDVIVHVTACTICSGSDSHLYAGEIATMTPGFIMGHEAMGIVVQKGDEVKRFELGDRVVIAFDIACGSCAFCNRNEFTGCQSTNASKLADQVYGHGNSAIFGYSRMLGDVSGSQADYVRVPIADVNCYPVHESIPDDKALFASDVACTSLHAVDLANVTEGDTVCIWGLGPIGLGACRWSQIRGAKRIIAIDLVPERLELAQKVLGVEVIDRSNMTSEQLVQRILELVPEGVDCAIEAVGFRWGMSWLHKVERAVGLETDTPEILYECFKATRPFGSVGIIGDYIGLANHFPVGFIMMKHLNIASGQCPCQKYFPYVMEKMKDGTFDPRFMISHRIKLEDAPMAYDKLYHQQDGYIKVFITTS